MKIYKIHTSSATDSLTKKIGGIQSCWKLKSASNTMKDATFHTSYFILQPFKRDEVSRRTL